MWVWTIESTVLKGMHMYLLSEFLQKLVKLYLHLGCLSSGARTHQMFRERSRISLNIVVACINGSRSNKKRKNRGRKDHKREGSAAVDVTVSYILNGMSAIHWILQPVRSHILQKWDERSQKGKFWSNINKTLYENTI